MKCVSEWIKLLIDSMMLLFNYNADRHKTEFNKLPLERIAFCFEVHRLASGSGLIIKIMVSERNTPLLIYNYWEASSRIFLGSLFLVRLKVCLVFACFQLWFSADID